MGALAAVLNQAKIENGLEWRLRILDLHNRGCLHKRGRLLQHEDGTAYVRCSDCQDELPIVRVPVEP